MEFKDLFLIYFHHRPVVDPDRTVSCRTLTLEHAQYRLAFFFEELPCTRIRKAPQLPVIWQIPRPIGNPGGKQEVQIPSLVVVLHRPVLGVAGYTMNVKGKPLQKLTSPYAQRSRPHQLSVVNELCLSNYFRATENVSQAVYMLWRCGLACGRRRKIGIAFEAGGKVKHSVCKFYARCRFAVV